MPDLLFLKRDQPQEWLLSNVTVPNPVTATLRGEDGQVSGVPVAFLAVAADGSFIKSMRSDGDEEAKQITLDGVETNVLFSYVSLLYTALVGY